MLTEDKYTFCAENKLIIMKYTSIQVLWVPIRQRFNLYELGCFPRRRITSVEKES